MPELIRPIFVSRPLDVVRLAEDRDWSLDSLKITPKIWDDSGAGEGVLYVVGDTGACPVSEHRDSKDPEFAENFSSSSTVLDRDGHARHVAGTVIAQQNDWGYVGIAHKAGYGVLKLLGDNGSGSTTQIEKGYYWLANWWKNRSPEMKAKYHSCVLNLSIGGPADARDKKAIDALWEAGVVVMAAMGNSGRKSYEAPGIYGIGVAALDRNDKRASFSTYNEFVDMAAPGVGLVSFGFRNAFVQMSGTCLAEGSYVYTPQGPRTIETMQIGDVVYAQKDGKIVQRVITGVHDRGNAEVHNLVSSGRDVLATSSHQMLAVNTKEKEIEWVRLGELKQYHRLVLPRRLESQINPYLDTVLSKEFCWLAGFFLGDGWISYTSRGMRMNFASGDKLAVIQEVERLYQQIVGKPLKQNKSGTWHYDDCTRMAMIFDCLSFNLPAKEKTLPMWLWNISEDKQRAFYDGYTTADGHFSKTRAGFRSYECASGDLMRRLNCWADYQGLKHDAFRYRDRLNKAPNSKDESVRRFFATGVNQAELGNGWRQALGVRTAEAASKQARDMGIDPSHYTTATWTVREQYSQPSRVYDLTVPDADCFITQGLVTHNSMATPACSGCVVLILSTVRDPALRTHDGLIEYVSAKSPFDVEAPGKDTYTGLGKPNVEAASISNLFNFGVR